MHFMGVTNLNNWLLFSICIFLKRIPQFVLSLQICNPFLTAERRRNSRQLEFLFTYYVRMLDRNHMELKLSGIWESIVKGLQLYPFSPQLHYALVEISHLYTSPNKLRWTFDDHCRKYNSLFIIC